MSENSINDSIVKSLVNGLNDQQTKAVTLPFGRHWLILAGAGCGKTSVLTKRIAFCARMHCEQNRILALTFTRKAAEEMQSRLVLLPGINKSIPLPTVTTFHGYGLHILRDTVDGIRNFERLGYKAEPQLLTERKRLALLAEISDIDQRRALQVTITELDDLLAQRTVNPQKISRLPDHTQKILQEVTDRFSRIKIERNYWEFSDMIVKVLTLFSHNSDVAEHYAQKFAYILVDEFQDTNPLQVSMLNRLLSPANSLFAVGDDDQAIYGFRGADIGPIMHFKDYFAGADIVKLETNYRSKPAILTAANKIFSDKPLQYRKVLVSGKYGTAKKEFGVRPEKKFFRDSAALAEWIINRGNTIEKNEGIPFSDMAVLFRLNESLDRIKSEIIKLLGAENKMPQCMTIHGSKGLEFPVVFLCDLEESVFPHYKLRKSHQIRSWTELIKSLFLKKRAKIECDFEEEKRMFYVGVTRAEKFLFLLSVRKKVINNRNVVLNPSRFLRII